MTSITPITVNYVPKGDDWNVTVEAGGKTVAEQAPGLIAARDRADQLVEKLVPEATERTVVHLLDGDAFAFTTAYLRARHGIPDTDGAAAAPRAGTAERHPAGKAASQDEASAKQLAEQE